MARTRRRRQMPSPYAEDPFADERDLAKRKLRQLCRQVERALTTALADDCADEVLLDLMITAVLPWPNAGRLLVAVQPVDPNAPFDREEILAHLEAAKGPLREIVAASIHRKRTPELCFEVLLDLGEV